MIRKPSVRFTSVVLALTAQLSAFNFNAAQAQGPLPVPAAVHQPGVVGVHGKSHTRVGSNAGRVRTIHHYPGGVRIKNLHTTKKSKKKAAPPPPPPQALVDELAVRTLAPGVIHKVHRGAMFINVLDVDLANAPIMVKPVLAGESFNKLDEVRDQAQKVAAIAAVNGNYFKRDGTPLGTLIIDGEWIAGPLYDRTCMGITDDGRILVDRVKLHGTLSTSNPEVPSIWVNNINQPRRHGCHLIAYTRRWGDKVKMQYEGTLVAVDYNGQVTAKAGKELPIPPGGYVLSDSKESAIAKLNVGDNVHLSWHTDPAGWSHVINAVSGGPVLIRDGKLFVDFKNEKFCKSWTGSQIHARTAIGVTGNRHLLLATIEGPHTLWDVAKFLKKLGAVDAMNLDGGGSTTMVIGGQTVTRNSSKFERRVASALTILPRSACMRNTATEDELAEKGVHNYGTLSPSANGGQTTPPVAPPVVAPEPAPSAYNPDVLDGMTPPTRYANNQPAATPVQPEKRGRGSRYFGWMKHLNPLR
jgi:uncharacterized protein YigE (DUF2233 family)